MTFLWLGFLSLCRTEKGTVSLIRWRNDVNISILPHILLCILLSVTFCLMERNRIKGDRRWQLVLQHFYIWWSFFTKFLLPFHAAPNPLYTFSKGHGNDRFLTLFATFFVADYRIIVCFRRIFTRKTKFHTKRESFSKRMCHFAAWGGG
jgi:hypothetical protein